MIDERGGAFSCVLRPASLVAFLRDTSLGSRLDETLFTLNNQRTQQHLQESNMAVLTILPEPIANPAIYSTLRNASSINATSKGILADFQSATAETIAEGTAGAGTSTTAAVTAQGLEAFYLAQVAAGLTQDEAIQHLNPAATRKVISFNIVTTGTTTEAQAEAVVLAYTNALGLGEDVIVATVEAAVLALATTTLVTTFELSLDSDPTGETSDLTIGAAEIAFTTAADIDHTAA